MVEIGDAVIHAAEQAKGQAPSRAEIMFHAIKETKDAQLYLVATELTKESISQLHTQTAALTSAVAETYSKEDEFQFQIRNLEGVVTTKAVVTGDAGPRRANKETRETELKDWIKALATKYNKLVGPF